jgi:peptidoglycan/LPS O-acetylase OafA/YrhL
MRSTSLRYMPGLDGLRALAIAIVFVWHCFPGTVQGVIGVDIFFVLSGFLITRILLGELDRHAGISLRRFYASRLLRLWPPLVTLVIAGVLLSPLEHITLTALIGDSLAALLYVANIVKTVTSHPMAALGHTWSLAMEEQFYLLWPAALLWMTRRRWTRCRITVIATAGAVASLAGWLFLHGPLGPYDPLIQGPGALLLGCALALSARGDRHVLDATWLAWLGAGAAVATMAAQVAGLLNWPASVLVTVCIVPVVAHVAFGESRLVRLLSARPLVFLGVISYEVYLTHFMILYVLERQTSLGKVPIAGITLVATLAAALAMHYGVTRPVLRRRTSLLGARTVPETQPSAQPA